MDNTRLGVIFLGLIGVIVVIGVIFLAATGHETPQFLVATGSASVAAIAGILGGAHGRAQTIEDVKQLADDPT